MRVCVSLEETSLRNIHLCVIMCKDLARYPEMSEQVCRDRFRNHRRSRERESLVFSHTLGSIQSRRDIVNCIYNRLSWCKSCLTLHNLRSNVIYRSRLRFLPRSLFRSPYRENRRTIDRESDRMQIRNCEGKREREGEKKKGREKERELLTLFVSDNRFVHRRHHGCPRERNIS